MKQLLQINYVVLSFIALAALSMVENIEDGLKADEAGDLGKARQLKSSAAKDHQQP